jgi:flagellar hook-length control protein FliK
MLNTTPLVAQGPMAALAPSAPSPTGADAGGQDFARALGQAAARQRDASGDSPAAPARDGAEAPTRRQPEATDARPAPGLRAGAARKAGVAQTLADDAAQPPAAAPGDTLPEPQCTDDTAPPKRSGDPDQPPPDLSAWVSGLPLPRPAFIAAAGSAGAEPAAAAVVLGATGAATAHAPDNPDRVGRDAALPEVAGASASAAVQHADPRATRASPWTAVETVLKSTEATAVADTLMPAPGLAREPSAAPRPGLDAGTSLPMLPGNWTAGMLGRPVGPSAPLQAELHSPVGSKDFAPALGSQLSVMVRDGIDHAQLKLNPTELGPIEVRISLDGTQAQVDFSAAHAATRQALQDAVPALASALRESGLTLTGGGVFEQPRESRGDAPAQGRTSQAPEARGSDDGLPAAALPRLPHARGVLDLYV